MKARTVAWAMPLTVLLAWTLRVYHLGYQELRGDEAFGYFFQQPSFGQIIRDTISLQEPHPVASYFVQKVWLAAAGQSEFALRFTSAWFSVLAVALLYRLARRLPGVPRLTAWLGAALLALSPYILWHSQDARMYGMLLAVIIASSWLALEAVTRDRLAYWAAYVVVTWLALHTHYSAAFVLIAQNLCVVIWALLQRRWRHLWHWLAAEAVIALLYVPWLWLVGGNLAGYSGNGDSPGLAAMLYRSLSALAFGETVPASLRVGLAVLAGILVVLGFLRLVLRQGLPFAGWWLAAGLLVPLGATWLSAATRPIFNERYLVAAVPPFYLLLAAGLALPGLARPEAGPAGDERWSGLRAWLAAGAAVLLVAGMLFALSGYYTDPAYSKTRGWRDLAATFRRLSAGLPAGQVRIAENFPDPTLWYYYDGPVEHVVLPPAAKDASGAGQTVDQLAQDGVSRVLIPLMPADNWDPGNLASTALAGQYTRVAEQHTGAWPLEVYVRPDPAALQPVNANFANGLVLKAAGVEPRMLVPGGLLAVHLAWSGSAADLHGSEKLFIHLADVQGKPVAQVDVPWQPALLDQVSSFGLTLPENLPAASYRVVVGLYDPNRPGAPRLLTAAGADHIVAGEFPANSTQ